MWDSEMVLLLRYVIDDIDEPTKYTDDKLQQLILVSAQFVQAEVLLAERYTIDVENFFLTPDPTTNDYRDDTFINLIVLKSACLLASSPLIKSAGRVLRVKEGQHEFDSRGTLDSNKLASQTFCQAYKDAKWEYSNSGSSSVGEVIIGPYKTLISRGHPWR